MKMTSLPNYMTEEFFRAALITTLNKKISIMEMEIKRNTTGGNYCSDIYRANIKYSCDDNDNKLPTEVRLLVKDLFENLSENSREHFMYTIVLPKLNSTLKKIGIGQALSPKVYLSLKAKNEIHIFEDLSFRDYKICSRLLGYNELQAKMVFWKLGQFHATSMIFKQKNPKIVATMKEFFCKSDPNFMPFVESMINDNTEFVCKIVETWPNYTDIAVKMRKNTGAEFRRKFLSILDKEDAKVRVIAHGDMWINNILLLESNGQNIDDAVFLDFQNCFDGSPAFDINNLLITSVQLGVLQNNRLALIEHYYVSLRNTLQAACNNFDIPTLDSILKEIHRIEYFTYYSLLFNFPLTNLSEELAKDMDFASFCDATYMAKTRADMFYKPRVMDTYKYVLKRLDAIGVLD